MDVFDEEVFEDVKWIDTYDALIRTHRYDVNATIDLCDFTPLDLTGPGIYLLCLLIQQSDSGITMNYSLTIELLC